MYGSLVPVCLCAILTACVWAAATGQREHESHGARSPSERFQDEHYKGGHHNDDLDHQAMLGSKKDAEEYDQLSPEESKRRLRILATRMDKNSDGNVDREEMNDWIHDNMIKLDAEEAEERFDEIDEDKDGAISWKEYKNDAFGEDEGETDPEDKQLMEEDERYFKAADSNGDGKLDKNEFAAFQVPENHEHMHQTLIDITLKEKDLNKDGLIDFEEFMGDMADGGDSEFFEVEKDRFESDYDKNKDGKLDREEMKRWLVPDSKETAREETDHLFTEADHNKDDVLSIDEIVEEHQLFVGSEATNYGEHLEQMRDEL